MHLDKGYRKKLIRNTIWFLISIALDISFENQPCTKSYGISYRPKHDPSKVVAPKSGKRLSKSL